MDATGSFYGTKVDFAQELVEARRLMGLKTTDLDRLFSTVTHLYFSCPQNIEVAYRATMDEIVQRQTMLAMAKWKLPSGSN